MMSTQRYTSEAWYIKSLDVYNQRISIHTLVDSLLSIKDDLGMTKCESCVSIGAGIGDIDVPLLEKSFPCLQKYITLDPSEESLAFFKERLNTLQRKDFLMEFVNKGVEDWEGPEEPVDLVLIIHCLYHIPDRLTAIKRSLSWLKPGGTLCIVHATGGTLFVKLAGGKFGNKTDWYTVEDVRSDLNSLGCEYEEKVLEKPCDIRDYDPDVLNFVCQKNLSQKEYEEVTKYLDEELPNGVDKQESNIIWTKVPA